MSKLPVDLDKMHASFSRRMEKDARKIAKGKGKHSIADGEFILDIHPDQADDHLKDLPSYPKR